MYLPTFWIFYKYYNPVHNNQRYNCDNRSNNRYQKLCTKYKWLKPNRVDNMSYSSGTIISTTKVRKI